MSKPILLYSHTTGPNPWKVVVILEELGVKYETKVYKDLADLKKPDYERINPNGRVPAIQDPNTGITLWESGAIIEYLVETYDTEKKITYTSFPEKYLLKQWLHFQMSGQGPYFGQAAWFTHFHHEKIPSAQTRYRNEIKRVLGVLNKSLEGKEYLVGDKATYADLSFVTWQNMLPFILGEDMVDTKADFPNYHAWNERLIARPAVKKAFDDKKKAVSG